MTRLSPLVILLCLATRNLEGRPLRRTEMPPGTSFLDTEQTFTAPQSLSVLRLVPGPAPAGPSTGTFYVDQTTGRLRIHRNGTFHDAYTAADVVPSSAQYHDGGVPQGPWDTIDIVGTGIQSSLDGTTLTVTVTDPGGGGGSVPTGTIMPFAGAGCPSGYLFCYGQDVSRATYANLFTEIAEDYGAGDGTTTFTLPDLRGRSVAGKDDMGGVAATRVTNSGTGNSGIDGTVLGATGGVDRFILLEAQLPTHTHGLDYVDADLGVGLNFQIAVEAGAEGTYESDPVGLGEAHPQMPPTIILNWMIKY